MRGGPHHSGYPQVELGHTASPTDDRRASSGVPSVSPCCASFHSRYGASSVWLRNGSALHFFEILDAYFSFALFVIDAHPNGEKSVTCYGTGCTGTGQPYTVADRWLGRQGFVEPFEVLAIRQPELPGSVKQITPGQWVVVANKFPFGCHHQVLSGYG